MNSGLSSQVLADAANQFGTPLYVYDSSAMARQVERLKIAFTGLPVKFFYAAKALTNINILKFFHSQGTSVDCSSINEVRLARLAGVPPENILYTSNSISFREIGDAADEGVKINIDSLSNLKKFGKKFGHSYPVGIRLRPNIMAGGNLKISTGHDKSKFGIPIDQVEDILQVVGEFNIHVSVLHIHTGSGISDVEMYMKGIRILFELIHRFPEAEAVDLGGGFKVPFEEGDKEVDIDLLAQKIKEEVDEYRKNTGRNLEIWFEPGKFFVSEAGYLVVSVNVLKETSQVTFAGVNSGFNHLIRPMFYGAYHHVDNLTNPGGPLKNYAVVGQICETDTFAWDRAIPEIREGDLLSFRNAGAYGFEMSSNFNSRLRPAEVMLERDGTFRLIRKRETFEDLLRNQIF